MSECKMPPPKNNQVKTDDNLFLQPLPLESGAAILPAIIETIFQLSIHPIISSKRPAQEKWQRLILFNIIISIALSIIRWAGLSSENFVSSMLTSLKILILFNAWSFLAPYALISLYCKKFVPAYIVFRAVTLASFYCIFISTIILIPISVWFYYEFYTTSINKNLNIPLWLIYFFILLSHILMINYLS